MHSCFPNEISATARVILRVTKVRPRRGDSWLNSIPLCHGSATNRGQVRQRGSTPLPAAQGGSPNSLARKHPVCLAVIYDCPVCVELGTPVRAPRIEWRILILRRLPNLTVHLRSGGLGGVSQNTRMSSNCHRVASGWVVLTW